MNLRLTGYEDMNWIELAQNHVQWMVFVGMAMELWVP
jgi:hypothetical protein